MCKDRGKKYLSISDHSLSSLYEVREGEDVACTLSTERIISLFSHALCMSLIVIFLKVRY